MEPPEKQMTAEESLKLITTMIHQAKTGIRQKSFYFLLWGWIVALAFLGGYILLKAGYQKPYMIWFITIPGGILSFYYGSRTRRESGPSTQLESILMWAWLAFVVTIIIFMVFGREVNYHLNALILLVSAIPTLVSGVVLRFRPMLFGAVVFWITGTVCFLVSYDWQLLVGAVAVTLGYLVPGYLLKRGYGP
ncbi:MAG: hypothetical protein LOY03_02295 [Cyclobacteriaceae bacterium]|jgi:hypothetical protein|nr:hypothetical protein [Cyclobacteriaceae bacterium]